MLCGMLDNVLYSTVNNECEADTVQFVNYDKWTKNDDELEAENGEFEGDMDNDEAEARNGEFEGNYEENN